MREVVVLSGKGGTGKTSIVGSFAALVQKKVLVDWDVDATDLHLILKPVTRENHEFWSGQVAFIDKKSAPNADCVRSSAALRQSKTSWLTPAPARVVVSVPIYVLLKL